MSRTYELVCHDCKSGLCIGQGRSDSAHLYTTDEHLQALRDFLFSHQQHHLEFGDSEEFALLDYENADDDEDPDYKQPKWPDDYWHKSPEPPSTQAWEESIASYRADRDSGN